MNKAFVIMCNDIVMYVILDNEEKAKEKMLELHKENYQRLDNFILNSSSSIKEYDELFVWHIQVTEYKGVKMPYKMEHTKEYKTERFYVSPLDFGQDELEDKLEIETRNQRILQEIENCPDCQNLPGLCFIHDKDVCFINIK